MRKLLDSREFYDLTLKEAGVTPLPDEIEKFAESKKIEVGLAKLARAYFEQMQLDKLSFVDETARANDAMKMAQAYEEHVKECQIEAVKIADNLLRFLTHATEGYLAQNNIQLDTREAIKVAALQAESAQEFDELVLQTKKQATVLGGISATTDPHAYANTRMTGILPEDRATHVGLSQTATPQDVALQHQSITSLMDRTGMGYREAMQSLNTPQSSFLGRNGTGLALGAAGLGALYLMHKRKQENEARDEESLRHAASLPAL